MASETRRKSSRWTATVSTSVAGGPEASLAPAWAFGVILPLQPVNAKTQKAAKQAPSKMQWRAMFLLVMNRFSL